MLRGEFRDQIRGTDDRLLRDSGWQRNAIAPTAWPVLTALLRNDPAMRGLLFCAVGRGDPAWDGASPTGGATVARLHREDDRRALTAGDFTYLDARGGPAPRPTDRLEITARFSWSAEPRVLREFGLFGGDATVARDSGYLINYVVHPRLDVRAGDTLTRRVRFTMRPGGGGGAGDWLALPEHWLSAESPRLLDGVGDAYAGALAEAAVKTIGGLAQIDVGQVDGVPLAKLVELRAKARLTLRTAASLASVPALAGRTAWDIIVAPPVELAAASAAPPGALETLREQLAALQLALDARFLKRVTVGELGRRR